MTLHALDVDLPGTDADGDGLPDAWEQRFFGGPTNAVAGADADGDGFDNAAEFRLGTHPRSAASGLWLTGVAPAAGGRGVTWRSVGGRQYRVDAAPDVGMAFTNVALVAEDDVPGDTETEETYADTNAPASPTRSYRVRLAP